MTLPCDDEDIALFRVSTMIYLGNRRKAIFWHDKWLHGSVPIDIAPNLYKLARFKSRSVARELRNKSWMGVARHISSREELVKFIKLWSLIKSINLREDENDHIQWKMDAKWGVRHGFGIPHAIPRLPPSLPSQLVMESKV
jgi:hypothetical protein